MVQKLIFTIKHYHSEFRVDLVVMAMKKYSTLLRAPELKPHYQIEFFVIQNDRIMNELALLHKIKLSVCFAEDQSVIPPTFYQGSV